MDMNEHDLGRKNVLIKTLRKAIEQAETATLYLNTNDRDLRDIERIALSSEYIQLALGILSREDDGPTCRVCGCTEHHPCPNGCWWTEPNLCSTCVDGATQFMDGEKG